MSSWSLGISAVLLSLERVCYVWAWRAPDSFRKFCDHPMVARFGEPIRVLQKLFYGFKGLQLAVFFGWCYWYGGLSGDALWFGIGSALILMGQVLNFSVFYRLGSVGVFYGTKFGYQVPWCRKFPFSLLKHPQYVGTLVSIWGFFLAMRFPYEDWFMLPTLETVYYAVAARLER